MTFLMELAPGKPPVLTAPPAAPSPVTTSDIELCFKVDYIRATAKAMTGDWYLTPGQFGKWDIMMECGRSYMADDGCSMSQYLKSHTSSLSEWQKLAYTYCKENPKMILEVTTRTHFWRVFQHGEYVEFALPHQTKGGEKHYVSRNGKTKVLVNED